jgi:S-DNA-T family DNA segregation ATPase FtsK/SpoIIIE
VVDDRKVLLGFTRDMKAVIHDFRVPHLLIGGMSGYGKTDLIRWIIYQLITRFSPDQIEIYIIDLKGFSFLPFRNIPHIKAIGRNLAHAYTILKDAVEEMNLRSSEIWDSGNRHTAKIYPWRIVLIDEAAQIAPDHFRANKEKKKMAQECDAFAGEISCVGREAGIGLIYCTQRPDANVVNPQVKANTDASIGFRTKNRTNSEIIIGRPGAETLPESTPGRLIYSTTTDIILQVPYIGGDYEWEQLLRPYTTNGRNVIEHEQESTEQTEYTQLYVPNSDSGHQPDSTVCDWSHFPKQKSIRDHAQPPRR